MWTISPDYYVVPRKNAVNWMEILNYLWSEHSISGNDLMGCRTYTSPKSGKMVIKVEAWNWIDD